MALKKFSLIMLGAIKREMDASPAMKEYINSLMQEPNPVIAVSISIRKAMINELDPGKYTDMAGRWHLLRKYFRKGLALPAQGMHGLGATAPAKTPTPQPSAAVGIANALTGLATPLIQMAMAKYQMDMLRKQQRKIEAREREAAEAAARDKALAEQRARVAALLEAKTGPDPSVGQVERASQEVAAETTQRLARDEVRNQEEIEKKIAKQGAIPPAALVAVPVAAIALTRR